MKKDREPSPIELIVEMQDIARMKDGIKLAYGMEATDDYCRDLLTFVETCLRSWRR